MCAEKFQENRRKAFLQKYPEYDLLNMALRKPEFILRMLSGSSDFNDL